MTAKNPGFGDLRHVPQDFSFVLGGPLYQLMRRGHLCGAGLELLPRRILAIALFCWLPLLVLAALQGELVGGRADVPFLLDLEVHVKFLVVVPMLVAAEVVVHRLMRLSARQFLDRDLIAAADVPRFHAAVASAFRLRNSVLAEVLLVAAVYLFGVLVVWRHFTSLEVATWYATPAAGGTALTLSGMWYGYVSLPVLQFLLLRWYFRLFIWAHFLWQVSRLELKLVPTHPDRNAGLGFLTGSADAFVLLAVAHGALLAGQLANRIFHVGAVLTDFRAEVLLLVVFVECLVLAPLLPFAPKLAHAKRIGKIEYGTLAQRYVEEFDLKWLRGRAAAGEALLGSADVQSLADMGNSYEVVRGINAVLVSKAAVVKIAVATFAPIAPLALTMMPLEEMLKKLFGIVF